jgi:hypothetical protein
MKYRKLRIAWSVAWGVVCVVVVAQWVQSYYIFIQWAGKRSGTSLFMASSAFGRLSFGYHRDAGQDNVWLINYFRTNNLPAGLHRSRQIPSQLGITWQPGHAGVHAPHGFAVILAGILAAAPAFSWSRRFSLRTMLIGMTLLAVGLSFMVWILRT